MIHRTSTADLPDELRTTQLSAFTYRLTHAATGKWEFIHVAIEPTASIARDPRKCWEPLTERYTQSKDHLLPLTHAAAFLTTAVQTVAASSTASTLRGIAKRKSPPPPPRSILFDAGATVPTKLGAGSFGWTGTAWLFNWYKARGIHFDRVFAWEPSKRPLNESALEPDFKAALVFYNRGCVGASGHPDNPLTVIKQECRPEDLCVFKLDIDTLAQEMLINEGLLSSPSMMALVDEYFFEHHVHNKVMRRHGLGGKANKKNSLASWYSMAIRARRLGLRIHFWP